MEEEKSKMTEEQGRTLEMPAEVLKIIGPYHLTKNKSVFAYNSALLTLEHLYQKHGIEWIRENQEYLRNSLVDLEGF